MEPDAEPGYEECEYCNGMGVVECEWCEGDVEECPYFACYNGEVDCDNCGGSGTVG